MDINIGWKQRRGIINQVALCCAAICLCCVNSQSVLAQSRISPAERIRFEQDLDAAEGAVLVEFVHSAKSFVDNSVRTTFQVRRILNAVPADCLDVNKLIQTDLPCAASVGESFLLLGTRNRGVAGTSWSKVIRLSNGSVNLISRYLKDSDWDLENGLPSAFVLLESEDLFGDFLAHALMSEAQYSDLVQLAPSFSPLKIRQWIRDRNLSDKRTELYALMLGMCGHDVDAKLLDELLFDRGPDAERVDLTMIQGLMTGYLLIRGSRALSRFDDRIFSQSDSTSQDLEAAIRAITFVRKHAPERIPAERICASMQLLLNFPKFTSRSIVTFRELNDWSQLDRLAAMYGVAPFDSREIKQEITYYLRHCAAQNDKIKHPSPEAIASAKNAEQHLRMLESTDPVLQKKLSGD